MYVNRFMYFYYVILQFVGIFAVSGPFFTTGLCRIVDNYILYQ